MSKKHSVDPSRRDRFCWKPGDIVFIDPDSDKRPEEATDQHSKKSSRKPDSAKH